MIEKSISTPVKIWLRDAAKELASLGITTALLDAEIILSHTLCQSRTWLHAHNDDTIDPRRLEIAHARLELRKDRVPLAYIIGHKEFYGRLFKITPAVLIPRPESEAMIDQLKILWPGTAPAHLLDVGTGSGCLGITAKLECPSLTVTLSDISRHALKVAEENADYLNAHVKIIRSNLLEQTPGFYDIILANLPYVDEAWERSPETNHEPVAALFANDGGLNVINRFLVQTRQHLRRDGLLLVEADPEQHSAIIDNAAAEELQLIAINGYSLSFKKN